MAVQPIPTRTRGPLVNASMPGSVAGPQSFAAPAPPPLNAPNVPTYQPPPLTAPPPTPTPFGEFKPPDPNVLSSAGQFRLNQGLKGIQGAAAARGTLLTGGLMNRLQEFGQGLASEEYGKDYQRALATYETNRGTNQQNYGQGRGSYQDTLAGYDRTADTARTLFGDARDDVMRRTAVDNTNTERGYQSVLDDYARQQDEARRSQELQLQQDAEFQRQIRENEAIQRAASARQNAEIKAAQPPAPYLPSEQAGARSLGRRRGGVRD